jgi:hypothetical protein
VLGQPSPGLGLNDIRLEVLMVAKILHAEADRVPAPMPP